MDEVHPILSARWTTERVRYQRDDLAVLSVIPAPATDGAGVAMPDAAEHAAIEVIKRAVRISGVAFTIHGRHLRS